MELFLQDLLGSLFLVCILIRSLRILYNVFSFPQLLPDVPHFPIQLCVFLFKSSNQIYIVHILLDVWPCLEQSTYQEAHA